VLVTGRASDRIRSRVIDALLAQLPLSPEGEAWSVLELLHLRDAGGSKRSAFERVRWIAGGPEQLAEQLSEQGIQRGDDGFRVLERGLRFHVDPGWASPERIRPGFGLFLDQRENRARLAGPAQKGGDWLNLFAHTGAFSVSLLAAGAERVTSVDLSAAYLARLEENLGANVDRGVDPERHETLRIEGRRYLETLDVDRRFAGIVLDPPTAAAAGHRFWSLARDLEPLVRRCVEHLAPGGVLLVTQNRAGPPLGRDRVLEAAARRAGRAPRRLEPAAAGLDHPVRPGVPEGEPFEGWLLGLD
jgi:23S rRNA (cytosine1962-C5)-methyltransferase